MAMSDNVLVTAKTFSSLSSRILDVYLINESDQICPKNEIVLQIQWLEMILVLVLLFQVILC